MAESYKAPDGYLTTEGAAELIGVSLVTMRKLIRDANLQTFRDPRNKRVRLLQRANVERLREPVPEGKAAA